MEKAETIQVTMFVIRLSETIDRMHPLNGNVGFCYEAIKFPKDHPARNKEDAPKIKRVRTYTRKCLDDFQREDEEASVGYHRRG